MANGDEVDQATPAERERQERERQERERRDQERQNVAPQPAQPAAPIMQNLQPPGPFSFRAEEWSAWMKTFERYRLAAGMDSQTAERQVNILIYTMGPKAEDLLASFELGNGEKDYDTVRAKFNAYYQPKKNVIYHRVIFNRRCQGEHEPVEDFITSLKALAKPCEYGQLTDELVRDRILVGMKNIKLSEALQMEDCTLEHVVKKVRLAEEVKRQQQEVRGTSSAAEVAQIDRVGKGKPVSKAWQQLNQQKGNSKPTAKQKFKFKQYPACCRACGIAPSHPISKCPAKNSACHGCGRRGHWEVKCRTKSKSVNAVSQGEEDDDLEKEATVASVQKKYLGCVQVSQISMSDPWYVPIEIMNSELCFKIDTGADSTVMGRSEWTKLADQDLLTSNHIRLSGPGAAKLAVAGCAQLQLRYKDRTVLEEIYVLEEDQEPLLSRDASIALRLVARLDEVAACKPEDEYQDLFEGLGRMKGEYKIRLKEDAVPHAITNPRRVSIPLLPAVKEELLNLQNQKVIEPVDEPTEWCAGMVPVAKENGKIRITVDYSRLNEAVLRERHQMPSVEECLGRIAGAKIFSKIDANKGYFQIPLAEESKGLTAFLTPFGRFQFNRLPMGLSSSSEHYQKRMAAAVAGIPGVVNQMDDTLVTGRSVAEHDARLRSVFKQLRASGITLNKSKCVFRVTQCKFLGVLVSAEGIKPCPEKVRAIREMPVPADITAVRSFLGAVNHQLKFLPGLADITRPIRALLKQQTGDEPGEQWGEEQDKAFEKIKSLLTQTPTLALFDPNKRTRITTDASSYGLGGVLEQYHEEEQIKGWKAVYYISRSQTETEQRYAQIEKEALAVTWALERFTDYITGLPDLVVRTDHKPLISLLKEKPMSELSVRIQRFRMRLAKFYFEIVHVPGNQLYTADLLSRAPLPEKPQDQDILFQDEVKRMVGQVVEELPMSTQRLHEMRRAQRQDPVCQVVRRLVEAGWPKKIRDVPEMAKPYFQHQGELNILSDLLAKGERIVVPQELRGLILEKLHTGHLGADKCCDRARTSVWWIGVTRDIKATVAACNVCAKHRVNRAEPLIPSEVPPGPWQVVATDLCSLNGSQYLVAIDFFSKYVEVATLRETTAAAVILHLKAMFARHGTPLEVHSDNGPQYSSKEFAEFARSWDFKHVTSSPRYPAANGEAEAGVKIVKSILKKETDPLLGLLTYRSTAWNGGPSPAELLMGRRLRSNVPVIPETLRPQWPDLQRHRERLQSRQEKSKRDFDRRHGVRELPELLQGHQVWVTDLKQWGRVLARSKAQPRRYQVQVKSGTISRNRRHLNLGGPSDDTETRSATEWDAEDYQQWLVEERPTVAATPAPAAERVPALRPRMIRVTRPQEEPPERQPPAPHGRPRAGGRGRGSPRNPTPEPIQAPGTRSARSGRTVTLPLRYRDGAR